MDDHRYFENGNAFWKWLKKYHSQKDELWVCYYKKDTGKPSIDWEQSVEEALCYGWIDGIRKTIDEESYKIRFTPRRKNSVWSKKNLDTIKRLIKEKKMQPAGLAIYNQRKAENSQGYSYDQKEWSLSKEFESQLKSNKQVWAFFEGLIPSVKKMSIQWVMSAKKEETRQRRCDQLYESCKESLLIPPLRWTGEKQ